MLLEYAIKCGAPLKKIKSDFALTT